MTLKAVLVGTGEWAAIAHLPALRAQEGVRVVGCVSRHQGRADEFARTHAIPIAATSLRRLLDDGDVDLVCIATPPREHAAACATALDAGVAVFCEKPITNDAESAHELAARASGSGRAHTVGFSFRYDPVVRRMRELIRDGEIGDLWLLELRQQNPMFHPEHGRPLNWKVNPEHSPAGALFDFGAHLADLVHWLGGAVADSSLTTSTVLPGAKVEDIAVATMRLRGGALATLVASWVLEGTYPGITVHAHGSTGSLVAELNDRHPGGGRLAYAKGNGEHREILSRPSLPVWSNVASHVGSWIGALHGVDEPDLPTFADGAAAQQLLDDLLAGTVSVTDTDRAE